MVIFIFSKSTWNVFNFRKDLIKVLVQKKNKVYILAKKNTNYLELQHLGCKILNINFENDSFNILKDFFAIFKIIKLIIKYRPNIFLNFNLKPVILGSFVNRFFDVNVINTITGLGNAFLGSNLLKKVIIFFYKYSISKNNFVIFHNDVDKKLFLQKKIVEKNKAHVVKGSGVNINYFKYSKLQKKKITFLFIGRLLWNKGIKEFIDVSNFYKKNKNIQFCVIGETTEKPSNGITKSFLKKYFLNYNFKYYPFVNDIRNHIKKSTCVVLPSYREGASKVLLEAASIGRPLMASRVAGTKGIVINNYNGYTFEAKNRISLKKTIDKFLKLSFEHKIKMSQNSRYLAIQKFDQKHVIQKYIDLIYEKKK